MGISCWPNFEEQQIKAAVKVLSSGKVNSWAGEETRLFEKEFAKWCGTKYAIAVSNGSVALTLAYESIGIRKGDEIITTPRTFVATASCASLLGAKPIFAEICENSGLINAKTIKPLITKKTKAISVVHLAGWPADMQDILKLAKDYNLAVIEDCSQAHGAQIRVNDQMLSVGSLGDIGTWSFCQDKIMSTGGEGGMITTSSKKLMEIIWSLKDHGKSLDSVFKKKHPPGYKFLHETLGTNYRLTEFQSAIGRIQLNKLSEWTKIRQRNATILTNKLEKISLVRVPKQDLNKKNAWYKFYVYLNKKLLSPNWNRDKIIDEINKYGYPAFHGGCTEIYLEKCFETKHSKRLPIAKKLGETSLMFLLDHTISEENMKNYTNIIEQVLKEASQ